MYTINTTTVFKWILKIIWFLEIVTILIIIYVLDEDYIKKCWFELIKYENKNLYSIFFNVETKVQALW